MNGQLLLTLVDHAKPFKGLWRIYRQGESTYQACHSATATARDGLASAVGPSDGGEDAPGHCRSLPSQRAACAFVSALQFHGWSIDDRDELCLAFRSACSL